MPFVTVGEIVDVLIMTIAVGYVFMDVFRARQQIPAEIPSGFSLGFDWKKLWFSCMVAAPAVLVHELGHKLVAIAFGLQATFHAAYTWLGLGILLKLLNTGFIFFIPGYVAIQGFAGYLQHALISFAGPGVNLLLWLAGYAVLKLKKHVSKTEYAFWAETKHINIFLFFFNMLPIPGIDGFGVYASLWQWFVT